VGWTGDEIVGFVGGDLAGALLFLDHNATIGDLNRDFMQRSKLTTKFLAACKQIAGVAK